MKSKMKNIISQAVAYIFIAGVTLVFVALVYKTLEIILS